VDLHVTPSKPIDSETERVLENAYLRLKERYGKTIRVKAGSEAANPRQKDVMKITSAVFPVVHEDGAINPNAITTVEISMRKGGHVVVLQDGDDGSDAKETIDFCLSE
jgi:hypothetical protein